MNVLLTMVSRGSGLDPKVGLKLGLQRSTPQMKPILPYIPSRYMAYNMGSPNLGLTLRSDPESLEGSQPALVHQTALPQRRSPAQQR